MLDTLNTTVDLLLLPDRLCIYANALSKRVYLDAIELHIEYSQRVRKYASHFDWGYIGEAPKQLALAILLRYLPVAEATAIVPTFQARFIARWQMLKNVDLTINLRAIVSDLLKEENLLVTSTF